MLNVETTALLVIDIQGKLAHSVVDKELLFENTRRLVQGAQLLDLPIVWIEQYPQGLGPTIPEVSDLMDQPQALSKTTFSCCGEPNIVNALKQLGRKQLLVCGIEAHVCVYQSVMDLLDRGYQVDLIVDAISSRRQQNKELAIQKMLRAGAQPSSTEMSLFELVKDSASPKFRAMLELVK